MTTTSLNKPLKILQLDSDSKSANEVIKLLTSEGYKVEVAQINSRKQLTEQLKKNTFDLVFLSDNAQDCSCTDSLKTIKKLKVYTPVLIFSDILEEETIVNYITLGASDYILKTSPHRLVAVVRRIISNTRNASVVDYQNFFETSSDLMCTCDQEGHFVGINQAWGKITGYADAELIDKPFIEFVYPEDQKSAAAQFQKLFDSQGKSSELVCRFQTATGDVKWLHWKMKIQNNGIINAVVRDVTDSKSREVQLAQAHKNLQKLNEIYKADIVKKTLVADQIRDSVVVTDLKGNIVSWNKGSEKIFGYSPEETVGQHIAMIYPEQDYKYIQEEASNVLLEQGEKEFELRMRRKSGEVFEARLTLEVTRDSNGKVNGMLGYAIDMGPIRSEEKEKTNSSTSSEIEAIVVSEKEETESINKAEESEQEYVQVQSNSSQIEPENPVDSIVGEEVAPLSEEQVTQNNKPENMISGQATETVQNVDEAHVEEAEKPQKVFVPPVTGSGMTIMYLEDSLKHIHQVEKVLGERQDYRLITTQEPEDCVDMARQFLPTLILLDMDLPDTDVSALLGVLHGDSELKHIPVIAVSTDASSDAALKAKQDGFAEYLVKPVEGERFLKVVDSMLYADSSKAWGNAS